MAVKEAKDQKLPVLWSLLIQWLVEKGHFPQKIHRILLAGLSQVGKSTLPYSIFPKEKVHRICLFNQQPETDLIGKTELVDGNTVFIHGPVVPPFRDGGILVIDEIDQFSPDTRTFIHALLDAKFLGDKPFANLVVNGQTIEVHPDFGVIATTNAKPKDLPETFLNRFDLVLPVTTPSHGIMESMPQGMRVVVENHYAQFKESYDWHYIPTPNPNAMKSLQRLMELGLENACSLIFGKNSKEIVSVIAANS